MPAPDLVKVDFLKVFGQPERSTVCACERSDDSNLGMAIELFNGPLIHGPFINGPSLNGPLLNGPLIIGPLINGASIKDH